MEKANSGWWTITIFVQSSLVIVIFFPFHVLSSFWAYYSQKYFLFLKNYLFIDCAGSSLLSEGATL